MVSEDGTTTQDHKRLYCRFGLGFKIVTPVLESRSGSAHYISDGADCNSNPLKVHNS